MYALYVFKYFGFQFASQYKVKAKICEIKHDDMWQVPNPLLKGLQVIKCKHIRLQNRQEELLLETSWNRFYFTF